MQLDMFSAEPAPSPHVWAQEVVQKEEAAYMGLNLYDLLGLDIQSYSGRPSQAWLPVFQAMVCKEETGYAHIPAARAAVQAAEREGRPELCTDQQTAVRSNRNLFEYWNPKLITLLPLSVLKQLHVSTISLKYNQPHPDMLLKIPSYMVSMVWRMWLLPILQIHTSVLILFIVNTFIGQLSHVVPVCIVFVHYSFF